MSALISRFNNSRLANTAFMSVIASALVVTIAASLGRAVHNIQGALTDKPDIALYLLLPDEGITDVSLLRDGGEERHYLAETKDGPKLVKLALRDGQWAVTEVEALHDDGAAAAE